MRLIYLCKSYHLFSTRRNFAVPIFLRTMEDTFAADILALVFSAVTLTPWAGTFPNPNAVDFLGPALFRGCICVGCRQNSIGLRVFRF
jgi:hypothetical protein